MSIKLFTNELSAVYDAPLREMLISNFKTIEKALNDLDTSQTTLNLEQNNINQDLNNIKNDNEIRDANIEAIVNILTKYDVPIAIVDGKVVDTTKEGE